MSRPNAYEDLDEMIVSQDSIDQDDIKVGKQTSAKAKKSQKGKTPLQIQREEEQHRKNVRMVMTIVGIFAVVLALLIAVGVWMGSRVPKPDIDDVIKAERAETSGLFISETNIPELSNQGVKGLLKEAYYTKEGNLAVTLNLSNGTPKEMKIVKVGIRVFNDKDETIADQKLEAKDFQIEYIVKPYGRAEMYFEIDKQYVVKGDDPLTTLGTTLEIGCKPTDGSTYEPPVVEVNADNGQATDPTTLPSQPTTTVADEQAAPPEEQSQDAAA